MYRHSLFVFVNCAAGVPNLAMVESVDDEKVNSHSKQQSRVRKDHYIRLYAFCLSQLLNGDN